MFALERHTIFVTLAGSQAHGTAREGSDVDLRGVCVAPLSVRLSLFGGFEQYEGELPEALGEQVIPRIRAHSTASRGLGVKTECVIFDVAKLVGLCAAANPAALELLFADERDWVFETPVWRRLHAERRRFLTMKVQQTFLGYAMAQLKKIRTHRSWLLSPPAKKPSRADFGLPLAEAALSRDDQNRIEQSIAEKIRSYGIETVDMPKGARIAVQERMDAFFRDALSAPAEEVEARMRAVATRALHIPRDVVAALNAEKKYLAAMKHWDSYQTWLRQRNPARAELERKHGYDTKHAMHLLRLMRMGLEVLETGELRVRREDAAELSAVRDGALSFDELLAEANRLQQDMTRAAERATLPADVDHEGVDRLATELMLLGGSARD
ncbi:MAG: nucleotidyltransferase domain-containing protein [Polyangiaceae bacterium]